MGQSKILKLLIASIASNPNENLSDYLNIIDPNKFHRTILMTAIDKKPIDIKQTEIVKELLKYSKNNVLDVNIQDKFGRTAYSLAISKNNDDIVSLLSNCKEIDPTIEDKNGNSPLSAAFSTANFQLIKQLFDNYGSNININKQNKEKKTLLMHLCDNDYDPNISRLSEDAACDIIKYLFDLESQTSNNDNNNKLHKIDINLLDINKDSALGIAAKRGSKKIVKLLLTRDDITYENNWTSFIGSCSNNDAEIPKMLLNKWPQIDVNGESYYGYRAIMNACNNWRSNNVLEWLLTLDGIDINYINETGHNGLGIRLYRHDMGDNYDFKKPINLFAKHKNFDPSKGVLFVFVYCMLCFFVCILV